MGNLHDLSKPHMFRIPSDVVPIEGWKSADIEFGDIVIFDLDSRHSGLTNVSKGEGLIRLSMDIRVAEAPGKVPTLGERLSLSENQLTVRNERTDKEESYAINVETYVRSSDGKKRDGADILNTFKPRETVIGNP
ncbi:hypothetical protein [Paraburkholderia oxyphila]|uniref:hypothetical protein n=1 Tax=Paraburkholderia oxyphila TaxID=614212 RepID=UPI000487641A|nr:hypothetical protein [Paraburkholderia oxyphila]